MPLVIDGQSAAQAAQLRQQLKDTSEQLKQTQAALRQAQAELARVARVTTMGELAASIAHEVNQPLSAIVLNAGAGLHWLKRDEPDLLQVRQAFDMIVTAGRRAGDIIRGIRGLARKSGPNSSSTTRCAKYCCCCAASCTSTTSRCAPSWGWIARRYAPTARSSSR